MSAKATEQDIIQQAKTQGLSDLQAQQAVILAASHPDLNAQEVVQKYREHSQ